MNPVKVQNNSISFVALKLLAAVQHLILAVPAFCSQYVLTNYHSSTSIVRLYQKVLAAFPFYTAYKKTTPMRGAHRYTFQVHQLKV